MTRFRLTPLIKLSAMEFSRREKRRDSKSTSSLPVNCSSVRSVTRFLVSNGTRADTESTAVDWGADTNRPRLYTSPTNTALQTRFSTVLLAPIYSERRKHQWIRIIRFTRIYHGKSSIPRIMIIARRKMERKRERANLLDIKSVLGIKDKDWWRGE